MEQDVNSLLVDPLRKEREKTLCANLDKDFFHDHRLSTDELYDWVTGLIVLKSLGEKELKDFICLVEETGNNYFDSLSCFSN